MGRKIKIIFFEITILNYFGGLEKWFIDISKELGVRNVDLEIIILTRDNIFTEKLNKLLAFIGGYKFDKNILYKENDKNILKKLGNIKYIKCKSFKELRNELSKADVVYSKNEILEAFILKFIIGYKNIKKLIFGCHTALYYPEGSKIHNLLYTTKFYNFLTSGVDKFHVLNSSDENILKKLNRNVVKIFNPINKNNFNKILKENKFKIKIDKNKINLVWIGRLTKQKGIDFLIKIFHFIFKNRLNNIIIHIAGEGERQSEILELEKKYNFIKYYGHIEGNYIPSFLLNMDLYIHTSLWESYGLTIIEANMLNLPVLAFNIPGPNDLIENWKNGVLFDNEKDYLDAIFKIKKLKFDNPKEYIEDKLSDEKIYFQIKKLLIS